jgi:hypothetical protein
MSKTSIPKSLPDHPGALLREQREGNADAEPDEPGGGRIADDH